MGKNIVFSLPEGKPIKHIVIKNDNLTIYFKGFDELFVIMDLAQFIHADEKNPLTYIFDHLTEETKTERYHEGIDKTYNDDEHYHFERKDNAALSERDIKILLDVLVQFNLLSLNDSLFIMNAYTDEKNSQTPTFAKPMTNSIPFYAPTAGITEPKKNETCLNPTEQVRKRG